MDRKIADVLWGRSYDHIWSMKCLGIAISPIHGWSPDFADVHPFPHFKKPCWLWINTYRYIFSGMNIHKSQPFWCELQGYQGFDPSPVGQCSAEGAQKCGGFWGAPRLSQVDHGWLIGWAARAWYEPPKGIHSELRRGRWCWKMTMEKMMKVGHK